MSEPSLIIAVYHDEQEQSYAARLVACSLPAETYGIILHDIARQVAKMFAQNSNYSEAEVLAAILAHFDQEREVPTGEVYCKRLDS